MYSKIRALPSTEDAGVGFGGATRVAMDEFEYHKYDRENYAEILPPILAGGQLIIQSTADKLKTDTKFKELYTAARHGDNNFYPLFFPYDVVPGRTVEWYNSIDLAHWEKECRFPRNEKEALGTLKSRQFLDEKAIEDMYSDCRPSLEHDLVSKYKIVKIYRLPQVGRRYCLFTDPSDGKDDPHACVVIDQITGEQVAESHGKCPAEQCAQIHDELVRLYNAFNSFEINATAGGQFSAKIKDLNTPNQCHRLETNGKLNIKLFGWFTGAALKRNAAWIVEEAVRLRQIIPHSKECLDELGQIMQPEGEEPQKPRGGHDDYFDAWGRVLLLRKHAPAGNMKVSHFKYSEG